MSAPPAKDAAGDSEVMKAAGAIPADAEAREAWFSQFCTVATRACLRRRAEERTGVRSTQRQLLEPPAKDAAGDSEVMKAAGAIPTDGEAREVWFGHFCKVAARSYVRRRAEERSGVRSTQRQLLPSTK